MFSFGKFKNTKDVSIAQQSSENIAFVIIWKIYTYMHNYILLIKIFLGRNVEMRKLQNYARHMRRLLAQRNMQHKKNCTILRHAMRKRGIPKYREAQPPKKKWCHAIPHSLNPDDLDSPYDAEPQLRISLRSPSPCYQSLSCTPSSLHYDKMVNERRC